MSTRRQTLALGLALTLGIAGTGIAHAHGMMGPGHGQMGPGMMGPGMMGPGYGQMGPGMMGPGYGQMGPGMMGPGYGQMGPGMMGPGYGQMGPGMMGPGYGQMGPGMMGPGYGQMGPGMMGPGYGQMGPGMMGPGYGQMGPGAMGGGAGSGLWQLLDDEQRSTMQELRQQYHAVQQGRMEEVHKLREELTQLMQQERPDPKEVQRIHTRLAELQGTMMADRVRLHNAMQELLTDEQRKRLRQGMPGAPSPQ
ncbi:Spy/CpxP family protein refolding chaperone [Halomonas cerina]|uniref:Spy/CpxP family protein refolding chaperone n=1 Tax=Halomonas cerina TaxID=447424 RepID=A0A839V1P5_9GAMM|nr:Spy/CpxP family protein refolding chaperone [Halomonas cerina]MBB3189272.1 Spy/CpxP family protein refolding chaperone [Halomonas cerina]